MSRLTGPWLQGARFEAGLLIPARPYQGAFDLLLAPEHASMRGSGELVLPWREHLGFVESEATTTHGWSVSSWAGQGGEFGAALHLRGELASQSSSLPLMNALLVRLNTTPNWGVHAPLQLQSAGLLGHPADYEVVHALCTTLAQRPELRPGLAEHDRVTRLTKHIISTPHQRQPNEDGARRSTIAVISALRSLGLTHPIGGRPLPDHVVGSADELLPGVLERISASPYARAGDAHEGHVRTVVQRVYSGVPAWPFDPLFE